MMYFEFGQNGLAQPHPLKTFEQDETAQVLKRLNAQIPKTCWISFCNFCFFSSGPLQPYTRDVFLVPEGSKGAASQPVYLSIVCI